MAPYQPSGAKQSQRSSPSLAGLNFSVSFPFGVYTLLSIPILIGCFDVLGSQTISTSRRRHRSHGYTFSLHKIRESPCHAFWAFTGGVQVRHVSVGLPV